MSRGTTDNPTKRRMILVRNDIGWVGPFEACPKDEILFNFLALGCNPKTTSTAQLAGAILRLKTNVYKT